MDVWIFTTHEASLPGPSRIPPGDPGGSHPFPCFLSCFSEASVSFHILSDLKPTLPDSFSPDHMMAASQASLQSVFPVSPISTLYTYLQRIRFKTQAFRGSTAPERSITRILFLFFSAFPAVTVPPLGSRMQFP